MSYYVSAVIAAAGASSRMGSAQSKQFIPLLGKPAIAYTLAAFEKSQLINEIIIVCRGEDIEKMNAIAYEYGITKLKTCVAGGDTRAQSVRNGICALSDKCTHIAIHDGARPLITTDEIEKTVSLAFECGACSIGVPVVDTVKRISENGIIIDTPERKSLFAVRTPQVFEKNIYVSALANAEGAGEEITDDCRLVEMLDRPVAVIAGEYTNIKLTTPTDILYAEAVLKERNAL